jgi:hypothetical protein
MPALDRAEMEAFLEEGWVAKLGTLLEDGSPYINPVWYEWDGSHFWVLAKPLARFVANIKRDGRIFLVVDKAEFPYIRVNVQGFGEVVTEVWAEQWVDMTRRMTVRYLGEQGLQYLEARLKYDLSVIKITPHKLNTWQVTDFPPDRTFTTQAKWREF